jgi:uncharacterized membrane protein YhaH (DUF805 family)
MNEAQQKQSDQSTVGTDPSNQSAIADLKDVADRARAATGSFSFYKLFEGRLDETNYLYCAVGSIAVGLFAMMVPIIGMLISLLLMVFGLSATARRFHDINITGWAAIVLVVPVVGLLAVIYLCWKKGDTGTNPFGIAPDKSRDLFKAILNT